MTVTLQDIADSTGVTAATVSYVLNGRVDQVGEETQAKVLKTAQRLGYQPNAGARSMRSGKFGSVALVLSRDSTLSWMPKPFMLALDDELGAHNIHLIMAHLPDDRLSSDRVVPKLLREWMVDGALIDYTDHVPKRLAAMVDEHQLPVVWINLKRERDAVYPDDHGAAANLTRRLLDLGHRRIAYLDFAHHWQPEQEAHYSMRDRIAGYREAMQAGGCAPEVLLAREQPKPFDMWGAADHMLARSDRPTAVLTYGDMEMTPIVRAAQLRGLRVPEDLSLAMFGETPNTYPGILGVSIATALVPCQAVAAKSVAMLLRKIKKPAERVPSESVPFGLDEGRSLGPAPGALTRGCAR